MLQISENTMSYAMKAKKTDAKKKTENTIEY